MPPVGLLQIRTVTRVNHNRTSVQGLTYILFYGIIIVCKSEQLEVKTGKSPNAHSSISENVIYDITRVIASPRVPDPTTEAWPRSYFYGYHLINRDLTDSRFQPQADFEVRITLPAGLPLDEGVQAACLSPVSSGEPLFLPITQQGDAAVITVPGLSVYGVLVIRDIG